MDCLIFTSFARPQFCKFFCTAKSKFSQKNQKQTILLENLTVNGGMMGDNGNRKGKKLRIGIVGDIHDDWNVVADESAINSLNIDVCLFVGDFGNENVQIVQQIANFDHPKAVILGNHDTWRLGKVSDLDKPTNRVARQLKCLGEIHVGYSSLSFPSLNLTVVGARPFSQGGNCNKFQMSVLDHLYGIQSVEQSAQLIVENVCKVPDDHTVIILGHNGPTQLGSAAYDICGADFKQRGDWGDLDLRLALEQLRLIERMPALVTFGHMHEKLRFGGNRRMIRMDKNNETTFLNAAVVPRVSRKLGKVSDAMLRHFCVVEIEDGVVTSAQNQWVEVSSSGVVAGIGIQQPLIKYNEAAQKQLFDGGLDKWEQIQHQKDIEGFPASFKN